MRPRLVLALATGALALAGAPSALACGSAGYGYAGISSRDSVYGVAATLTSLAAPAVQNGHVAGWVGVGGPGLGPHGSSEWIQVGYSGFPGLRVGSLYYEVALPGRAPRYHEVSSTIRAGAQHRVGVLEMANRLNWWRVWVDGRAVSRPYHLPGSHGAWRGIATAENWGGGSKACNLYSYRFNRVAVAHQAGGSWGLVRAVYPMHQGDNRFVPRSTSSFVARTATLPRAPGPAIAPAASAASTTAPATPPASAEPPVAVDAMPPGNPPAPTGPNDSGDPAGGGAPAHDATP